MKWMYVGIALAILGGTVLRLDRLSLSTMGHTEIYTPNIELPEDYGNPRARLTLAKTVTNSLWEPHPPGWYVMMWGWTRIAGTSLFAIRFPSVLFGVLSVLLIFVLGYMGEDVFTALLAAALLAFNGHQIYWSQVARPSTFVCALGLVSTILLLRAVNRLGSSYRNALLYMLVAISGLASEHYFWLLFAAQMAFSLLNIWKRESVYPAMLAWQLLVLIVASPLITLAVFQGGAPYVSADVLMAARGMLEFGFLFDVSEKAGVLVASIERWLPLLGAALFLAGLLSVARRSRPSVTAEWKQPRMAFFVAAALVSFAAILLGARVLGGYMPAKRLAMNATAIVPIVGFMLAWLLKTQASSIADVGRQLRAARILPERPIPLLAVMAIVPFALAATLSQFTPLLATRQMLIMVPYVLIVIARGMTWIWRVNVRFVSVPGVLAVTACLCLMCTASISRVERDRSPVDYHALAEAWKPQVRASDVLLVQGDNFRTTPIFYYMKPRDYQFVGKNYASEVKRREPDRVWLLELRGASPPPAITAALLAYERSLEVKAKNIEADLYVRRASSPREPQ